MKTIFYKVLYKNREVVYIGVTTRTLDTRFREHVLTKNLNPDNYSIIEFYSIEHPNIDSLKTFYTERVKIANLERKYIQEERAKGSKLLNLSKGGEWNTSLLNKLKKDEFFVIFGSYEGYKEHQEEVQKVKKWLHHWVYSKGTSKSCLWVKRWISNSHKNKTKIWLYCWVDTGKENLTKSWIKNWAYNRNKVKAKQWLYHWIGNVNRSIVKSWLNHWISHRSENKTKVWLGNWRNHRNH